MAARRTVAFLMTGAVVGCLAASSPSEGKGGPCPTGMAHIAIDGAKPYCVDKWEATVVEVQGKTETAHAATQPVTNLKVRAVTRSGVTPQGYISKNEAEAACKAAKKRLCTGAEWEAACKGKTPTAFPYGDERKTGYCNDSGRAPLASLHPELVGEAVYASSDAMNDPRINQSPNTVAATGSFAKCRNAFGVYDMVGNLHEWVADMQGSRGTFRGGYYQDTHLNGDGCAYRTVAHDVSYHDYSTGFRCCADAK